MKSFSRPSRTLALVLTTLFFLQSALFAHTAESNFWAERKHPAAQQNPQNSKDLLLAALPRAVPVMAFPFALSALKDMGFAGQTREVVPEWMQNAVAPFATIQQVYRPAHSNGKTLLLLQDAHLHFEAQTNIAGVVNALGTALHKQSASLLIGMEGAPAKDVDFSAYNRIEDRPVLKAVADALLKANILNGVETAVMGFGDTTSPFKVVGLEKPAEFNGNVRAIRDGYAMKGKAADALAQIHRRLALEKNNFTGPVAQFDRKMTAFNEDKISLPEYAQALNEIHPVQSPEIKKLLEAAALEHTIDFGKVEGERNQILKVLLPKLNPANMTELLQYSAAYREGQISFGAYYEYFRDLCAAKGAKLSRYPHLDAYIRYVLKTDKIDPIRVAEELEEEEASAAAAVAQTPREKDLLAQTKRYFLLKKLTDFSLTENEWARYSKGEPLLASPLHDMGRNKNDGLAAILAPFENFYAFADARNTSMAAAMTHELKKAGTQTGLMVAGGFHTARLLNEFKQQGFTVLTLCPKITQTEEGPSSVDVLASGRLPLDRLFAGERLNIPVPPATASRGPQISALVNGIATTVRTLLRQSRQRVTQVFSRRLKVQAQTEVSPSFEGPTGLDLVLNVARPEQAAVPVTVRASFLGEPYDLLGTTLSSPAITLNIDNRVWLLRRVTAVAFENLTQANFNPANTPLLLAATLAHTNVDDPHLFEKYMKQLVEGLSQWNQMRIRPFLMELLGINRAPAEHVAKQFREEYNKIAGDFGLQNTPLNIHVYSGNQRANMNMVSVVDNQLTLDFSTEFLDERIFSEGRIQNILNRSGDHSVEARLRAIQWLTQQYLVHEILEAVWRKKSDNPDEDKVLQQKVHNILVSKGLGLDIPDFLGQDFFNIPLIDIANSMREQWPELFFHGPQDNRDYRNFALNRPSSRKTPISDLMAGTKELSSFLLRGNWKTTEVPLSPSVETLLGVSRDGRVVFASIDNDGGLGIFDRATGREITRLPGGTPHIFAQSLDGRYITYAVKSILTGNQVVYMWDISTMGAPRLIYRKDFTQQRMRGITITALALSPEGDHIAVGMSDGLIIFDDQALPQVEAGSVLAIGFEGHNLFHVGSMNILSTFGVDRTRRANYPMSSIATRALFSADGARCFYVNLNSQVIIINPQNGQKIGGTLFRLTQFAINPAGTQIAAGGSDGDIRVTQLTPDGTKEAELPIQWSTLAFNRGEGFITFQGELIFRNGASLVTVHEAPQESAGPSAGQHASKMGQALYTILIGLAAAELVYYFAIHHQYLGMQLTVGIGWCLTVLSLFMTIMLPDGFIAGTSAGKTKIGRGYYQLANGTWPKEFVRIEEAWHRFTTRLLPSLTTHIVFLPLRWIDEAIAKTSALIISPFILLYKSPSILRSERRENELIAGYEYQLFPVSRVLQQLFPERTDIHYQGLTFKNRAATHDTARQFHDILWSDPVPDIDPDHIGRLISAAKEENNIWVAPDGGQTMVGEFTRKGVTIGEKTISVIDQASFGKDVGELVKALRGEKPAICLMSKDYFREFLKDLNDQDRRILEEKLSQGKIIFLTPEEAEKLESGEISAGQKIDISAILREVLSRQEVISHLSGGVVGTNLLILTQRNLIAKNIADVIIRLIQVFKVERESVDGKMETTIYAMINA